MEKGTTKPLSKVIRIDESEIRSHLTQLVRGTVEETLKSMLDDEADELCQAQRYERSADRIDTRAGHYKRKLHTPAGEVELKMPKLRRQTFETAIVERYWCCDISIEEAIVQMYLAGVSVRRVEDVTEALWGTRVSSGTVSKLNQKVYKHIERWRSQKLEGSFAYVYLDGLMLKQSWGGEIKKVSLLAAIGVDQDGFRHILGVVEGHKEDKAGWLGFLKHLKKRGLSGVRLIISDACLGLAEAAQDKARDVVEKLKAMRLAAAAKLVEEKIDETLAYYAFPSQHWLKIRTNNPMERLLREARRRTKVVGAFPDGNSALMLVAARLRHVSATQWGTRKYMNMELLREMDREIRYRSA